MIANLQKPRPARSRDSAVPMINVVLLLLIFVLMTAQLTPAPPFAVTPPEAARPTPGAGDLPLYLSAGGALAYGDARGSDAIVAAARAGAVTVVADAALPATRLARTLSDLRRAGAGAVTLQVTAAR